MARSTGPPPPPGIDFNHQQHVKVLERWFPRHYKNYDYPETAEAAADEIQFYTRNSQFSWLDSRLLFVLLMALKPRRIIEVGSGFSSLLMADVKARLGPQGPHITCIEPYPREWALEENRSWNEQYLLQALLAHSNKFSVFFGCCYAHYFLSESLSKALGRAGKPSYGGGSFWIKSCR